MFLTLAVLAAATTAQPDTADLEAPILTDIVQLTTNDQFLKAGEAYFNPKSTQIIFQATPLPEEGQEPSPHYEMYLATVSYKSGESGWYATGLDPLRFLQVSQPSSANTCGWFHPTKDIVLFGSTILPPQAPDRAGYQRGTGKYRWQFPAETEIVSGRIDPNYYQNNPGPVAVRPIIKPLWKEPGYTAEASYSPDGNSIIYTWVNPETNDPDIYIRDLATNKVTPIITAKGYDGGPFFSPDGHWITYRSDRKGNNLLQIFIAELSYDDQGRANGIKREIQLTDNEFVNWAPYWHPSGAFLIYSTNEAAPERHNYEVFAIDARGVSDNPKRIRLTYAEGFDGLPVFNASGTLMMWTSQRGATGSLDRRSPSQIWIARFNFEAFIEKFTAPDATADGE
jgi:TolB protein